MEQHIFTFLFNTWSATEKVSQFRIHLLTKIVCFNEQKCIFNTPDKFKLHLILKIAVFLLKKFHFTKNSDSKMQLTAK